MRSKIPGIVILGIAAAVVLVGLHALGARRSTSVISGIVGGPTEVFMALTYIVCWFTTLLVTPIVVIAWALLWIDGHLRNPRR